MVKISSLSKGEVKYPKRADLESYILFWLLKGNSFLDYRSSNNSILPLQYLTISESVVHSTAHIYALVAGGCLQGISTIVCVLYYIGALYS